MKLITSSFVTRPFLPVAGMAFISSPFNFAICLTAGVERALESKRPEFKGGISNYLPGPDLSALL